MHIITYSNIKHNDFIRLFESQVITDRLRECLRELTDDDKRVELEKLRQYIGKPIAKTDNRSFLDDGNKKNLGLPICIVASWQIN